MAFSYSERVWQYAEAHDITYNETRMSSEFKALWHEHQDVMRHEERGSERWREFFGEFYAALGMDEWDEEGWYH